MFGIGKHGPDGRYGVIIDIGSGSVGIAIVVSDPLEKRPEIVWSSREYMTIKQGGELTHIVQHISTALLNAMLRLGSEGIRVLKNHDPKASLTEINVAISAPWSFLVTRNIAYSNDEPFKISSRLIEELTEKAKKEALETLDKSEKLKNQELELIFDKTISVRANDYTVANPVKESAKTLGITHMINITYAKLLETLKEAKDKVAPRLPVNSRAFIYVLYNVVRSVTVHTKEMLLVDITSEATEIGLMRDGLLTYSTHLPIGLNTLARAIAQDENMPFEEALGMMRDYGEDREVSKKTRAIWNAYENDVAALFTVTGDTLSLPRTIFVHTDKKFESFSQKTVGRAARISTTHDHSVHLITSTLLGDNTDFDTALMVSAQFFHLVNTGKIE